MDNFESKPLLTMPFQTPLKDMTDQELAKLLASKTNYNILIPALIEANLRKDTTIAELTKRVAFLEDKTLKKDGRPKTRFYVNGQELTDDYLIYLIDYEFFTIRKLEKEVCAGKTNSETVTTKQKR